jgi:hypothetical protein
MAHDHDRDDEESDKVELPAVEPVHYQAAKMSTRARPQWDPKELAHQYLDDMEKGGRLHLKRKRS